MDADGLTPAEGKATKLMTQVVAAAFPVIHAVEKVGE
jgi:hypothetical protein